MRLGARIGEGCAVLHDRLMRALNIPLLECDEIWGYVGKKQRKTKPGEADKGDQYTYIALDATRKTIVSYVTGKRNPETTRVFINDLWERIINRPQISTDGYGPYIDAIAEAFADGVDYAQLVKSYSAEHSVQAARRYSPAHVVWVDRRVMSGQPDRRRISTAYVERQNLTLQTQQRRFTRLSSSFSKKLENHCAAVSLYVSHYNLCRVHETIRMTPAMALGVTDHIWTIGELVERASQPEAMPERRQSFTVIDGGLS